MALLPPPCSSLVEEEMLPIEERRRAVDLSRYFQAVSITDHEQAAEGGVRHPPNAMLVALCQLGALRLDTNRAFISLLDHTQQYIVGEATRTTGLSRPNEHADNDALMLGFSAHPLEYGVCPETVKIFSAQEGTKDLDTPNITATKACYVIRDFTRDERFRDRSYVAGWPDMRSYAEVPLTSPNGYVIGSFCVIDDRPRNFDDKDIVVLTEIASVVMDHIDLLKIKLEKERADCLVFGIGSYVDGAKDLHQPPAKTGTVNDIMSPSSSSKQDSPHTLGDSDGNLFLPLPSLLETLPSPSTEPTTMHSETSGSEPATTNEGAYETYPGRSSIGLGFLEARDEPTTSGSVSQASNVDPAIRAAFTRASSIIRQAMDLHSIAFVDASVGGPQSTDTTAHGAGEASTNALNPSTCALLSSSTKPLGNSPGGDESVEPTEPLALDRDLMRLMLLKYPLGQVFTFDRFGEVSERVGRNATDASSVPGSSYDTLVIKRRHDVDADCVDVDDLAARLFSCIGVACSVAFFPLWDFQQDRWFASGVAWTTDISRVLDQDDLNYFAAFGHSIMAETLKVQASALSSAKSDFISSISHELRSPLHGILASLELLQETLALDYDSSTMLNNAYSCSTMLLDTMNNLLDFARINRLSSDPQRGSAPTADGKGREDTLRLSSVDMAVLVEDVVRAVHVSFTSASRRRGLEGAGASGAPSSHSTCDIPNPDNDIAVLVYVQPAVPWHFRTDVGAWKRIVMNLVGNALKYTEYGHVEARLEIISAPQAHALGIRLGEHILLQVTDTGRGISRDFLEHRLFTPFAQENNLSVGTGLGLSLVRQLAESLRGTIDVGSEVGAGTCVKVRVPLGSTLIQGSSKLSSHDPYRRLRGRTLVLTPCGTPTEDAHGHSIAGFAADTRHCSMVVRDHLADAARGWLGMNVAYDMRVERSSDGSDSTADQPIQLVECGDRMDSCFNVRLDGPDRSAESTTVGNTPRRSDITFSHPFGPQTLAKALLRALEVVEEDHLSADHEAPHALDSVAGASGAHMPALPIQVDDGSSDAVSINDKETSAISASLNGQVRPNKTPSPASHPSIPILPSTQPPQDHSRASSKSLLLVDDNEINLKLLVTCARKENCVYQSASNGLEALEIYKATALLSPDSQPAFDLVIMDLSMPIMDGYLATREIRTFESSSGIPRAKIVALTALGSEMARERAWVSGTDAFVTKPLSVRQMRELCRGVAQP
ncbi:hypothetical protein LTR73_007471 [Friedmanniomyces endolithicus]|nr:hypothetical protein LTR73_007471 [Friedmanniomyces endolithicus]